MCFIFLYFYIFIFLYFIILLFYYNEALIMLFYLFLGHLIEDSNIYA